MNVVRFSHLRAYGRSPMHGHHARTTEMKPNPAMELGSAVHALILRNKPVCAYPGPQRRGKEYAAFAEDNPGSIILTSAEYEKASQMANAVRKCKLAEPLLAGTVEETILFDWMGLPCRATPDVRGDNYLTELKTSSNADPAKFVWHALRQHYHAQMRMQQIACANEQMECYIVCVESAAPYPVSVFRMDEKALEAGEKMLILWAERLKTCEQSESYPPYAQHITPIELPEESDLDLVFPETEEI